MPPTNVTAPGFSGHETFPFRYSWLKKGIEALINDPGFLSDERAMVYLGVGKNMVRSIRHWCLAAGLVEEVPAQTGNRTLLDPTPLARRLFSDTGYDSYLEDPATLWLIHWQIASNLKAAATWYWVFNLWNVVEFTKAALISEIQAWLEAGSYKKVALNSLKRDADCFIRTYVHSRQAKESLSEDTLSCPLVDLHLIEELADAKTYRFQRGPQGSLPDEVLVFALLEFWRTQEDDVNSIAFEKIAFEPGSPGKIFKMDEDSLVSRLERVEMISNGILRYDDTAGLKQVYRRSNEETDPLYLIDSYYRMHENNFPLAG